mmetsp:Transcript_24170/g.56179  ORF Transcript_24170/g.56179 Transcript_24170/m.56179 type:complete len:155 (+) Transcript_24170:101-565(+)
MVGVSTPNVLCPLLLAAAALPVVVQATCSDAMNAPPECCEMERAHPCLTSQNEMWSLRQSSCSLACQRKYQTLGYDCWADYHNNFQWTLMEQLCDPDGLVNFQEQTTTREAASATTAEPKVASSAVGLLASSRGGAFFPLIALSVTTTLSVAFN